MELLSRITEVCEPKQYRAIDYSTRTSDAKYKLIEIKEYLQYEGILLSFTIDEKNDTGFYFLGSYSNSNVRPSTVVHGRVEMECTDRMYKYILKKFPELKNWRQESIVFRPDGSPAGVHITTNPFATSGITINSERPTRLQPGTFSMSSRYW